MNLDQYVNVLWIYPLIILLFVATVEFGRWLGKRGEAKVETLTVSSLGLLALLLAFSLSHALSRYEDRRALVTEEAVAIAETAHYGTLLDNLGARVTIGDLLREYLDLRSQFAMQYDPDKMEKDAYRSQEILGDLWRVAGEVADPLSQTARQYYAQVGKLSEIGEKRVMSMRYHVPTAVLVTLLFVGLVAIGLTGYQRLPHLPTVIASVIIAVVIVLVIDLDQPARGFITVPNQAFIDVEHEYWAAHR